MSWTDPRTWNAGETVTATIMNEHIRDNMNVLSTAKALVVGFGAPSGAPLAVGVQRVLKMPFAFNIVGWALASTQSGTVVFDIWKSSDYPTVADSICSGQYPIIASGYHGQNVVLVGWDTEVAAGEFIAFAVNYNDGSMKGVDITLHCEVR